MTLTVALIGGTGLIGRNVTGDLLHKPGVTLYSLGRRHTASTHVINFEQLCEAPEATLRTFFPERIDVAISCLGTTIRTAGSQSAMSRVDHDYVLAFARGAQTLGARQFITVSSVGAGGSGFYLKTKGLLERNLKALDFPRLDILRPGVLLGQRHEDRPGEALAQRLLGHITPMLPKTLARFGAIEATTVAGAISLLCGAPGEGCTTYENTEITAII